MDYTALNGTNVFDDTAHLNIEFSLPFSSCGNCMRRSDRDKGGRKACNYREGGSRSCLCTD